MPLRNKLMEFSIKSGEITYWSMFWTTPIVFGGQKLQIQTYFWPFLNNSTFLLKTGARVVKMLAIMTEAYKMDVLKKQWAWCTVLAIFMDFSCYAVFRHVRPWYTTWCSQVLVWIDLATKGKKQRTGKGSNTSLINGDTDMHHTQLWWPLPQDIFSVLFCVRLWNSSKDCHIQVIIIN